MITHLFNTSIKLKMPNLPIITSMKHEPLNQIVTPNTLDVLAKKLGYRVFTNASKPFNVNIWGVRANDQKSGKFDDYILVFWMTDKGWDSIRVKATVDPSDHYLLNPIHKLGTAIIKTGQHTDIWRLGKHKGNYDALIQRQPITLIRDFDKDDSIDYDPDLKYFTKVIKANDAGGKTIVFKDAYNKVIRIEDTGFFGINFHRASKWKIVKTIGLYSAGCVVVQDPKQYGELINVFKHAADNWGNSFTFTLVTENQLRDVL